MIVFDNFCEEVLSSQQFLSSQLLLLENTGAWKHYTANTVYFFKQIGK